MFRLYTNMTMTTLYNKANLKSQPKSNLVHFSFKISHLVATILIVFLKIN